MDSDIVRNILDNNSQYAPSNNTLIIVGICVGIFLIVAMGILYWKKKYNNTQVNNK